MTDNLFMTLLKEIVEYRKYYKVENTSLSGRYLEYRLLVETLKKINYTDDDQHSYLSHVVFCKLDHLYEGEFADI